MFLISKAPEYVEDEDGSLVPKDDNKKIKKQDRKKQ